VRGDKLSRRETACCEKLVEGYSPTQIAARLGVCEGTVSTLLKRARAKVGAESNPRLAVLFDRTKR
jgi:DNA-binding CsgD family transcriptional regulator